MHTMHQGNATLKESHDGYVTRHMAHTYTQTHLQVMGDKVHTFSAYEAHVALHIPWSKQNSGYF